jgi:hypothetical protein
LNRFRARGVFYAWALFHRPIGDETNLLREETIFAVGEDMPKPALCIKPLTKQRAAKAQ